jgi:hypothetical protein
MERVLPLSGFVAARGSSVQMRVRVRGVGCAAFELARIERPAPPTQLAQCAENGRNS